MTELSFLVELLLNPKLPRAIKELVAARIKAVEESYGRTPSPIKAAQPANPFVAMQSPSTQALMAKHPDLIPQQLVGAPRPDEQALLSHQQARAAEPVAIVAQTPAAMAAMSSREQAIAEAMSGKVNKETGRPRKF